MKKFCLAATMVLSLSVPAFANFDFGATTYETADDILVVNSLGDQPVVSTFGTLGTNDWIQESAVKNQLKIDGYTLAYDYNPTATHPWGVYDQPLPVGGPSLTKLTFAGLLGDPRKTQDVYVLTSEYNRLSDQGQATSIDNINVVNNNQTNSINSINSQITTINAVDNAQNNAIINNSNYINSVNVAQTTWNQNQDVEISNLNNATATNTTQISNIVQVNDNQEREIASTNSRLDETNERVGKLERTQVIVTGEVRLYDSKKWAIHSFLDYSTTRNTVSAVGLKVTYKLGESYEEREIRKLNRRLDRLEGVKNEIEKQANTETYYTGNGLGMRSKF